MPRRSSAEPGPRAIEFAAYVGLLADELSRLAREHGLGTLAYLLDMARLEARSLSHGEREGDGRD